MPSFQQKSLGSFALLTLFFGLFYSSTAVQLRLSNNYILDYNLLNNRTIEFKIQAINVTGWVGLGINNRTGSMPGSDLYMGGFNASTRAGYGRDYHVPASSGNTRPTPDPAQNWDLISVTELRNTTTLTVRRLLNTTDRVHDLDILNRTTYLIWSYNNVSDDIAVKHTVRGSRQINLLVGH